MAGPTGRASKLFGGRQDGRRSALVAVSSTIVFFGLLVAIIVNSPGWPLVQHAFFNARYFAESWPRQVDIVVVNVQLFLWAEAFILPLALVLAVLRSLPGP